MSVILANRERTIEDYNSNCSVLTPPTVHHGTAVDCDRQTSLRSAVCNSTVEHNNSTSTVYNGMAVDCESPVQNSTIEHYNGTSTLYNGTVEECDMVTTGEYMYLLNHLDLYVDLYIWKNRAFINMAKSSEMQTASRSTPPPPSPKGAAAAGPGTKFESPSDTMNHIRLTLDSPEREQDLMYMKKGWLIKMGTSEKDWKKHWFVLTGNSLRYYKDAKAEESNSLDGRIDLSTCYEISEVQIQRNYGFKIKTQNGEYILSAMTSGIRSNWMKAIRLCMDLQNTNKSKESKPSVDSITSNISARTNDDMDIDSSSSSSRTSDGGRGLQKKKFSAARRHNSDVNPGNIGKMFSLKGITLDTSRPLSQSVSSHSQVLPISSSKEPSLEHEIKPEMSLPSHMDLATAPKHAKYDQYWHASGDGGSAIPFRRFVEGSDSHVTSSASSVDQSSRQGDKSDDEDRKRRGKSPSAKIKERSRAKSPKLHSPPPGDSENKFSYVTAPSQEDEKLSVSSDDIDYMDAVDNTEHLGEEDNLPSTMSSAGEGMLVDLLENEVESLKERLEHTQQELAKSHDSNRDLKTKLQTVVREKDSVQLPASIDSSFTSAFTQTNADLQQTRHHSPVKVLCEVVERSEEVSTMKRQLKEAKDTVSKQKSEIDQLKSKLDMSTSKLTGTEKALSEALKDVKQEKDKFLKVSTEYNRKVRNLENQLKEVTQKMEKYHENSLIKDKENRKLDLDLKQTQQMLRDHEREILKLKAVEHEYRQTKEKLDETEKIAARMRMDMKEKEEQMKKLEMEYDEHYESLMHEFAKERDATEHHIEELKEQLVEAQKKSSMSEQVSSDVADMFREKDEIIAQLEEKVIESETKVAEVTEELKAEEEENSELQHNIEMLQSERDSSLSKFMDLEKSLQHYQTQVQRMEKENASIRKHMDDLRKENTDLSERLNVESSLVEDNDSLKSNVKELEEEVHSLHEKLKEVIVGHELSSHSDLSNSQDLLHTFILASSEIDDVNDTMVKMRKQFETILSNYKGDQKQQMTSVAQMLETLGQKCENISDILKEGSGSEGSESQMDVIQKQQASAVESAKENDSVKQELEKLKQRSKEVQAEAEKWKKELSDVTSKYEQLKTEDIKLKEEMQVIDEKCQGQLESLKKRVDEFSDKSKVNVKKSPADKKKPHGKMSLSDEIEVQLCELEESVGLVEKVLATQDLSTSGAESDGHTETEDESETETEDSDDYLDSESEESEAECEDGSTVADDSESLLGKLKEMKKQLMSTNNRIKELTGDLSELDSSGAVSEVAAETELRQTLLKCGEKIDSLTSRLSDGLKGARTEVPRFSDCTWAFQKCIGKLKEKLTEVSVLVHEHNDLNAKDLKTVQEKLGYLADFVRQMDKLGESDWDIAGKIAKQELKFQHLLAHKEKATRKSTLKYEDRLQLYADKLAFEAVILGQMGILIQKQQIGTMYKDVLLREIHEANLQIIELERKIDNVSREMNQSDQEKDLVSSYAAVLAEKIVLEGQLASGAMVQDVECSETLEVLSALNVSESPAVLAMEIFIRSQLDSSVTDQLQKFAESMNSVSNHVVTRALLQGEITHALQVVKRKLKPGSPSEDLSSLVKRERQFAFEELKNRHKLIIDLMNENEPLVMTTLIQLIEFSQGPNSPTLDSVCEKISEVVDAKITELEKALPTANSESKTKLKHINSRLHSELTDAVSIFREEYHCYVQTASPDINPNVLRFSADSLSTDLAEMIIQKAVIDGSFNFIHDLYDNSPEVPVSQLMESLPVEGQGLADLSKSLGQILLTEAANKQKIAEEVRNMEVDGASGASKSVIDLVGVIPDLEAYPQSFDAYAATLVREAMFQSQLTYTTYKLKLQYHRQLRDIKMKMEAGEKVVLPSEISKEAESDIQASLNTFEEILNTKYQDECEVLNQLEAEIDKLKSVPGEKGCSKCKSFETTVKALEKTYKHEVSVAQERQNVHINVLRQEVNNVLMRVDKFLEDHEKEKESLIADYEDRINTLQDEFDLMRVDHEEELEQVKQDIMTAVSAIKATGDETELTSHDQMRHHNKQLMKMCSLSKDLLVEIKNCMSADQGEHLTEKIERQLSQINQLETDPSYTLDVSVSPSSPKSPSSPTVEPLKQDRSFKLDRSMSAERSDEHVDKLLERSQHEHEMEQLKREKEEALADEIKVTKAALDAMRKAYEEELDQEKEKYRNALKTMFTDNYVDDIRRRHDVEVEKLSEELKQVTMHYESRCEDYKLLEDRLSRTKSEYQTHINQLVKSNEHLTEVLNTEIESLKKFIETRNKGQVTGNATLEEELYDSQIMVRVKDAELQKLRQQVKNLENSLERITEEQRYTMTQYLQCLKKNQEIQAKLREGTFTAKERRNSTSMQDDLAKTARALRRNPSFHQRARSPSPDSPRKDNSEHHSRDSTRRRGHLSAKDLKRSKSSPSLPFVFEAKGTLGSSRQSQPLGVSRRESGKHSKSGKK